MKWKNRLTNYNFWVSIVSAILLILQSFNIQFDISNFNDITTAVLGLMVVIGIINDPTKSYTNTKTDTNKTNNETTSNSNLQENKEISNTLDNIALNTENNGESLKEETQQEIESNKQEGLENNVQQLTMPIINQTENDFNINKTDAKNLIEQVINKLEEQTIILNDNKTKESELQDCKENLILQDNLNKVTAKVEELNLENSNNADVNLNLTNNNVTEQIAQQNNESGLSNCFNIVN